MHRHAAGRILLQDLCHAIGQPLVLQFRLLLSVLLLNKHKHTHPSLVWNLPQNIQLIHTFIHVFKNIIHLVFYSLIFIMVQFIILTRYPLIIKHEC